MDTVRRRLVLLRHSKAEHTSSFSRPDELRALTDTGRRNGTAIGALLVAHDYIPDLVLVSSATRTQQTWEQVEAALGNRSAAEVEFADELYGIGPSGLIEYLRRVDSRARTVLVVGHEPTMSSTAYRLASPESDAGALAQVRAGLPTSACAVLRVPEPWSELAEQSAELLTILSGRHP